MVHWLDPYSSSTQKLGFGHFSTTAVKGTAMRNVSWELYTEFLIVAR